MRVHQKEGSVFYVEVTLIATTQPATVIVRVQQLPLPTSASSQPAFFLVVDDQPLEVPDN